MAVISAIEKARGKYRVTLDMEEELLIPASLFRERPLSVGDALDLAEYDDWLLLRQYRHALDRAVAALAARARSRKELEGTLLRCGYRPATVEMVLFKLEKEHLLNDADFARQWVEARSGRTLGKRRIAQELQRKGIGKDEAEEALAQVEDEDEWAACLRQAEKLAPKYSRDEPRKAAQKLMQALVRRGFGWEDARRAAEQALSCAEE